MKNIFICPIYAVKDELKNKSTFFICSSSNPIPPGLGDNVFWMTYLDTEVESHPYSIKSEMLQNMIAFFQAIPDESDVFVCCDYGLSRSPAIAAALMRAQGQSDSHILACADYRPNLHVYRMSCEALGIHLTKDDLIRLKRVNDSGFCFQ